jgi:hypothetical protein
VSELGALLVPLFGEIGRSDEGADGRWWITVPLAPFSADDQYSTDWRPGTLGPEVINTAIVLDGVDLGVTSFDQLSGRSFTFPVNPAPGYIDGSIYLAAVHSPVDVTDLQFGKLEGEQVPARLVGTIVFDHELWGVDNHAFGMDVQLKHHSD